MPEALGGLQHPGCWCSWMEDWRNAGSLSSDAHGGWSCLSTRCPFEILIGVGRVFCNVPPSEIQGYQSLNVWEDFPSCGVSGKEFMSQSKCQFCRVSGWLEGVSPVLSSRAGCPSSCPCSRWSRWVAACLRVASHLISGDVKNRGSLTRLSAVQWGLRVLRERPRIALNERGRGLPRDLYSCWTHSGSLSV